MIGDNANKLLLDSTCALYVPQKQTNPNGPKHRNDINARMKVVAMILSEKHGVNKNIRNGLSQSSDKFEAILEIGTKGLRSKPI